MNECCKTNSVILDKFKKKRTQSSFFGDGFFSIQQAYKTTKYFYIVISACSICGKINRQEIEL